MQKEKVHVHVTSGEGSNRQQVAHVIDILLKGKGYTTHIRPQDIQGALQKSISESRVNKDLEVVISTEQIERRPHKVTRSQYTDLFCHAENEPDARHIFDRMERENGFEIVPDSQASPVGDLSINFMYPHKIKLLDFDPADFAGTPIVDKLATDPGQAYKHPPLKFQGGTWDDVFKDMNIPQPGDFVGIPMLTGIGQPGFNMDTEHTFCLGKSMSLSQAKEEFRERSNGGGSICKSGLPYVSPGKGGRVWLDGEYTLDELKAVLVIAEASLRQGKDSEIGKETSND
jgi:hypothetical protein